MKPFHIYRAPWDSRFTTFACKGEWAYELQVGPLVIQWFYDPLRHRRLHVWRDTAWRGR